MDDVDRVSQRVEYGRLVVIEYEVRLPTGKVVDSSNKSGGPAAFVCGRGAFPRPVEEGVIGLNVGQRKVIIVPPEYTHGLYDPKKVSLVAVERITEEYEVGKVVRAPDEFGLRRPALVRSVWKGALMLDFNHPLAGKTLHFEVLVKEVRQAPAEGDCPKNGHFPDGCRRSCREHGKRP
jgi:FKBP-type peptidyl-prolyl cis-trans isomerase SlyD